MKNFPKDKQYKHISAGIALGLILNDTSELPNDKVSVELAFESVWRKWEYKQHFPAMTAIADLSKKDLDVILIITRLDERTRVPHLGYYWDRYGESGPTIYLHDNASFSAENPVDIEAAALTIGEDYAIPARAWRELASEFLAKLDKDCCS